MVGIGAWGNNIPVAWAFDITNFVWWIGIGHAGTLISAILLLFQQKWRTSINRFAEAMTLFAVAMAGLYPIIHLGRPWFFWWLMPYPSTNQIWPNFKSALPWDVFAISTYVTVSFLFWFIGLIPDLATLRDTAPTRLKRRIYGLFAFGWRGSARHWQHYRIGYLLMAGLGTPLVVSVHTIVSFDFAISQLPGWHTTIFPPYFVAGAIFSGFAMVVTLHDPGPQDPRAGAGHHHEAPRQHGQGHPRHRAHGHLRLRHGALHGLVLRATPYEAFAFLNRWTGPYAAHLVRAALLQRPGAADLLVPVDAPQPGGALRGLHPGQHRHVGRALHHHRRLAPPATSSPASWAMYTPTWVDWGLLFGSMCTFGVLFLLFLRFLPVIPIAEVKELRRELDHQDATRPATPATGRGATRERPDLRLVARVRRRGGAPGGGPGAARPRGWPSSTSTPRCRSTGPTRRSA